MESIKICFFVYGLTAVIAFAVAVVIHLMMTLIHKFAPAHVEEAPVEAAPQQDETEAIAVAIAVAKASSEK